MAVLAVGGGDDVRGRDHGAHAAEGVVQGLGPEQVRRHQLRAGLGEVTAGVRRADDGADRPALPAELADDQAAELSGGADDEDHGQSPS